MKPYEFTINSAVLLKRLLTGQHKQTKFTRYLESIEYKSVDELMAIQAENMSALLKHSVDNIPYYRYFKGKLELTPETVNDDIKEFPVLTKEIILDHYDELIDREIRGGTVYMTDAATGEKVKIIRDREEFLHGADEYFNRLVGIFPGKSRLWIKYAKSADPRGKGRSYNMISRTNIVNPAYMDMEGLEYLYKVYRRNKPRLILGITETIYRFAEYIQTNRLKVYPVDLVGTGGQTMLPRYMKLISEVFAGAKVLDGYGATEFGRFAHQCRRGEGFHYIPAIYYAEAVDDGFQDVPPGQTGQLLVTNLYKRKMPLIRYRVEDFVILSKRPCDCGRGFPVIESFEGSRIESIVSPKHTYMTPSPFFEIMDRYSEVDDFLVEQRRPNTVTLLLKMKKGKFKEVHQLAVRKEVNRYLDYPMALEVEYIDEVKTLPNGKVMRVRGLESIGETGQNEENSY